MPAKRPNVLLITTDQQHWDTLSCLGSEVRTPNLDRLAERGLLCRRAYCPNPTCTPTRASIITGQYPSQHGAYSLGTKLQEDVHTVGEDFAAAGYATALVGKAHFQPLYGSEEFPSLESYPTLQDLDFWKDFDERFYGFDHVELARNHADEAHVGQHYALWMEERGCTNWRDYFRPPTGTRQSKDRTWAIPERYHYNTWITERSAALMNDHTAAEKPFFLWASYFDPHPPYLVPEPWASMYDPATVTVPELVPGEHDANPPHFQKTQQEQPDFEDWKRDPDGNGIHGFHSHLHDREEMAKNIAVYYGMISYLDHCIGQLLAELEASGAAEDTIVVFTTDHGHLFGQHGMIAKGAFHYEDLLRVPFIASWPGHFAAGERSDALVSLVDLAPTFLDCCGLPIPRCMTGVSQKAVWCGEAASARDHVLAENRHQPYSIHLQTVITERYKLTAYRNASYGELFDLQEDPRELRNLWDDPAHIELKAAMLLQLAQAGMVKEPLPMPRTAGA